MNISPISANFQRGGGYFQRGEGEEEGVIITGREANTRAARERRRRPRAEPVRPQSDPNRTNTGSWGRGDSGEGAERAGGVFGWRLGGAGEMTQNTRGPGRWNPRIRGFRGRLKQIETNRSWSRERGRNGKTREFGKILWGESGKERNRKC